MAASDEKKNEEKYQMEYRLLGGTGLKVSVLGIGSMSFNNLEQSKELMIAARKGGINFFDNAELYGEPLGKAEEYFGTALIQLQKEDALLWRRSDLVITTKLYFGPSGDDKQLNTPMVKYGENESGLSRKHLFEGMNNSLKRLQLDYVDVVFAHRFDDLTPMEEIVRGFTQIINDGKAFYWGTSMWDPQKITEAYWVAKVYNLIPPVVEQPIYNMFTRDFVEGDLKPLFKNPYNIGTTIWSPLDGGILTGKYNKNIPKDSRLGDDRLAKWFTQFFEMTKAMKLPKVEALMKFAKDKYDTSVINLAIAWVIKNKHVSVCMLGGSKGSQITANLGAIAVAKQLNSEAMAEIDKILGNKPQPNLFRRVPRQLQSIIDAQ